MNMCLHKVNRKLKIIIFVSVNIAETMKPLHILLSLLALASCAKTYEHPMESELKRVDEALDNMSEYVDQKEARIAVISEVLQHDDMTLQQRYGVYGRLYEEYAPYQFDKALQMLQKQEDIADSLSDSSLKTTALLNEAFLLTTSGLYHEADKTFSQLDTLSFDYQQKIIWYNARQKFLTDYQAYLKTSGIDLPEASKISSYQKLILENTPENSYLNRHISIMLLIWANRWEDAYDENLRLIETLNKSSRDYAVQAYWQGFICENLERKEENIHWWVESAICDIKGAIKDNAALCSIAIKLSDPRDTERAFRYIRLSLEDAIFYNAKLRMVQIASTMPWIEKAYIDGQTAQVEETHRYLVFISLAALLLLLSVLFVIRLHIQGKKKARTIESQNTMLAESNRSIVQTEDTLRRTNLELREANAAKEEYLGLFLSMCSGYLDKLKKTLPREQYDAELKNFYKTFDTSFLTLYPNFVSEFNSLLKEEFRITVKEGDLLTTELRIFALIKLGITQSSHIASLLRYSVNTIYNYRAQIKNAALSDRDNFEEMVRKIGSKS